jgi:asparaginyl-tRNA synthetase
VNFLAEIFTSEKSGSDDAGDGTEGNPFKTVLQAMRHAGKEPFPVIYMDAKDDSKVMATQLNISKFLVC